MCSANIDLPFFHILQYAINAGYRVVLVMATMQQAVFNAAFSSWTAPRSVHIYIAANAIFKAGEDIL